MIRVEEGPLHLDPVFFAILFRQLGPSLGLWRAAEVAALRTCAYICPVLDMGCGDGLVTSMVLRRVEIGCDPYREAAAKAGRSGLYGRIEPRPIEAACLPGGCISTILCNSVLEHIAELGPVMQAASRALAPGGRLVFTAPTAAFGRWLALPSRRYAAWRNRRLGHFNLWSAAEWAERLAPFGFDVLSVRPYLTRRLVAAWDAVDLIEQVWLCRKRLAGVAWRALPRAVHRRIARLASRLDLSSRPPGGGHLIIARKEG
jgi:SAM-dependent methyltransferase